MSYNGWSTGWSRKLLVIGFTLLFVVTCVDGFTTTTRTTTFMTFATRTNTNRDVRLVNSPTTDETDDGSVHVFENEGIIEIYDDIDKQWGPVCGSDIGSGEAETICKQLGYSRGYDKYYSDGVEKYGSYTNAYNGYVYLGLSCSGTETHIADCTYDHRRGTYDQCGNQDEVGALKCTHDGEKLINGWKNFTFPIVIGICFFFLVAFIRCFTKAYSRRTHKYIWCGPPLEQISVQTIASNLMSSSSRPASQPSPSHTSYQHVPNADLPPQYDKCVPSGPPPTTNPAYHPQGDPAFPPAGYTPQDEVPTTPPPEYNVITSGGP